MTIADAMPDAATVPTLRAAKPERGVEDITYYGRSQLKAAPFNKWVVGGYIFLAGLSGSSSLLSTIADLAAGPSAAAMVRRGRGLALLAPTLGSALLIADLHTPKRFYNMLRVAKLRSPMSIGTWILMGFSASACPTALLEFLPDRAGTRWLRPAARLSQIPAAISGAGLSVYTASLLAATSTPAWAAAPRALAVRFGASSIISAASALLIAESDVGVRRSLMIIALCALATEAAAATAQKDAYRRAGIGRVDRSVWGRVENVVTNTLGVAVPLVLFGTSIALGKRRQAGTANVMRLAAVAALTGSAMLRLSTLRLGDESANRATTSLRFAQPDNLPERRKLRRR